MAAVAPPHQPVMADEVVEMLAAAPPGWIVDGTLGAGGHAAAVLTRLAGAKVIGVDRDPAALELAAERLAAFGERVRLVHGNFRDLEAVLGKVGDPPVSAVLLDLGVSSMHFDDVERGFTYAAPEAALDMRMDPAQELTAAGLLNQLDVGELSRIIREYGEERWASRIAAFVVRQRRRRPLATAGDLVSVIKAAIPAAARRGGGHPARRTFQALRIAVNDELGALADGLSVGAGAVIAGGRLVVISFHSLEDRIVKRFFRRLAANEGYTLVTRKPIVPSEQEIGCNPRARSAKLRVLARGPAVDAPF